MSLNWKEINLILEELPLQDSHVQKIVQPDYRNLAFGMFRPGEPWTLLISLENQRTRLHATDRMPRKPKKAQRFQQFLSSRIKGGRVTEAVQVNNDRIIKMVIVRGGEETRLYIKLWGGASNIIATDASGTILDSFFRRPKRGETTGGHFRPENDEARPPKDLEVRELAGDGSFNEKIARYYRELSRDEALETLRAKAARVLQAELDRARSSRDRLREKLQKSEDADVYRMYGDLILANAHRVHPGDGYVDVENYEREGQQARIELDPAHDAAANAESYYQKARKARDSRSHIEQALSDLDARTDEIEEELSGIEDEEDLARMREMAEPPKQEAVDENESSGVEATSGGFLILIGRNSRENDALLRKHVRGNDTWLHARDFPGAYVFVKQQPGKSIPLDVLIDAGNLALFFSKARGERSADLYYTQVKYLRRAKHGKLGTVIPTQEKNLSIRYDQSRVDRLLGRAVT